MIELLLCIGVERLCAGDVAKAKTTKTAVGALWANFVKMLQRHGEGRLKRSVGVVLTDVCLVYYACI